VEELPDLMPAFFCSVSVDDPETIALRHTEAVQLNDALAEIPPGFREVIVLREIEGLSYKEIATVIDLPIGTVMSRLARARAELRRVLKRLKCVKGDNK
jgi:RNA polymerase sigma-70 factor (ECF subfamily)